MHQLVTQLLESKARGRNVACCRLLATRGSTPQKPGAMMLVFEDGAQAGTLGGGCIEAEVKRRALAVIAAAEPTVADFRLDDDYGWDDGLICGGRMHVLIDPVADVETRQYFQSLAALWADGSGGTEAIAFEADGGLQPTASYLFNAERQVLAKLRTDINPPSELLKELAPLSQRPGPSAQRGIALLPILPRCRLVIVGAGHVGQAVAHLAGELDFNVWVVDDRQEYLSPERFPSAQQTFCGPIGDVLPQLEIKPDTFCLIVTRGHNHDEEALYHLVNRGARYVGMIGSKRKIRLIFDDLLAEGIPADALAQVHAPVGLDIGSQTVPEIAVSIAAELIACRNLGEVKPNVVNRDTQAHGSAKHDARDARHDASRVEPAAQQL